MMSKHLLCAAGVAALVSLSSAAMADGPAWDLIMPNRSSAAVQAAAPASTDSWFSRLFGATPVETTASLGDRPVVTISAPAAPVLAAPAANANDVFFDPIERVFVTLAPGGTQRSYNPIPRQEVDFQTSERAGTIVVSTTERRLYLVLGNGRALRYGVGVGRDGFTWRGEKTVTRMAEWPDWRPPEQMLRRRPDLPRFMPGGPSNPLGARALYLGSSLFRIHGSNEPHTIGQAVSSGCFRMTNEDVADLYTRVRVGARVVVR